MIFFCNHKNSESVISGLLNIDNNPILIASRPITNSNFDKKINGTLIFGRLINEKILSNIKNITNSKNVTFKSIDDMKNIPILSSNPLTIEKSDNNTISCTSIIKGINNDSLFLLTLEKDRAIYNNVKNLKTFLIIISIIRVFVIILIFIIFIQSTIISPVEKLSKFIVDINLNDLFFKKIHFKKRDEITGLADKINKMLMKIEENNQQLTLVFESANTGFWDWDISNRRFYLNPKFLSLLGYNENELILTNKSIAKLIHKNDLKLNLQQIKNLFNGEKEFYYLEQRLLTKNKIYKWFLIRGNVVEYDKNNKPLRMTGIAVDISEKKKFEEEINYISYYDNLTGLVNRGYFEYILEDLIKLPGKSFYIIIADINGLKIVNDTFGHEEGDNLIIKAASVLKDCCKKNDIVSRFGGDEFAMIINENNTEFMEKLCKKIKNASRLYSVGPISVNMAIGYSLYSDLNQDYKKVVKEAEEMMYRNKLFEAKSSRSSIISSLEKALSEKSFETNEHTKRIYLNCINIGKILNLSNSQIEELSLISSLHDIGKIAIDDKILNKTYPLTEEEWEILKTHSEIGYRIATASPELNHVAYSILTHHERYDGKGYPKGLKGEEIPLLSRILSIVDAYEVMTNDSPYEKAISKEAAFEELFRCSGTQFDPKLIKLCIEAFKLD